MSNISKYPTFSLGEFNDMAYNAAMSLVHKPKSKFKKSPLSVCSVFETEIPNDNLSKFRAVKIYYRVVDLAISCQSDFSCDQYVIERVTYLGRKVTLSKSGEAVVLGVLNAKNPERLKF